jgi:hypothetical protein
LATAFRSDKSASFKLLSCDDSITPPLSKLNNCLTLSNYKHTTPAKPKVSRMLRQNIIKLARVNTAPFQRSFSMSAVRAGEGDVGATRSGGIASSYVQCPSGDLMLQGIMIVLRASTTLLSARMHSLWTLAYLTRSTTPSQI